MLGKNCLIKVLKNVSIYSHEYRDQNMGEKNAPNNFFQKHTNSAKEKCCESNRHKGSAKNVFYIHTNIVTKKWLEKNAGNNFSKYTRIVRSKNVGK